MAVQNGYRKYFSSGRPRPTPISDLELPSGLLDTLAELSSPFESSAVRRQLARMDSRKNLVPIAVATLLIEGATAFARFGLGLESTRDTATTVGRLTGGLRIHHGYFGLALLGLALVMDPRNPRRRWAEIFGWSLTLSDALHHFVVLWLATGSPQFDLFYR